MNIFIRAVKTLNIGLILIRAFALITLVIFIVVVIKGIIDNKQNRSIKVKKIMADAIEYIGDQASNFAWIFIILVIITIPVSLLTNSAFQEIIGLHNLYLEDNGHYCYSVDFYDYNTKKSYILPAEIEIDDDTWYLRKFVKPNGDVYIDDFFDIEIDLKTSVEVFDDTGNEFGDVKLLNEHTVSERIQETNRINLFSVLSLFATVVCCPFWLYTLKRHVKKIEQNERANS